MTFRRTNAGLSNLYLFLNAEAVVFVEGGQSFTREDIDNGLYNKSSSDIRFWQALFNAYRPGKNYQFRSVGSKEVVKSIAADIQTGRVSRVIAAMDRDFDHINARLISSENVVYTKGYSWENDSWNEVTIFEAFCTLSGSCKNNADNEKSYLEQSFAKFSSCLHGPVRIDAILSQYDNSLFDRKKPNRYITISGSGEPKINVSQLRASIGEARTRNARPIIRKTKLIINALDDCYGHLLAEFGYRLLTFLLGIFERLPKIPKEFAAGMVVEKFEGALSGGLLPKLKQHYDIEFAKVTA